MRVVFDTNVWVSAIRSRRGASYALLSEIQQKRFHFGISVPLFLEYKAKLYETQVKNQTRLTHKQISAIISALAYYGAEVSIYYLLRPNLKDEKDNMVFECAVNFGAMAIITHNVKDFFNLELKNSNIDIVTPGQFIKKLQEGA